MQIKKRKKYDENFDIIIIIIIIFERSLSLSLSLLLVVVVVVSSRVVGVQSNAKPSSTTRELCPLTHTTKKQRHVFSKP